MKGLIIISLSIIGFLLFGCAPEQAAKGYKCGLIDSSTIIISIAFPDIEKHVENDLIIFALIKNVEYLPIDDYDEKSNKEINERDSIFREVNSYYCCTQDQQVLIKIDSVVKTSYDCSDLMVGRFGSKVNLRTNSIASNFKLPCNKMSEKFNKDSGDSLYFKITNDSIFKGLHEKFKNIDFELIKLQDSEDFICIANAEDSLKATSNLYFIDLKNNSLSLIDVTSEELELDSWGRGYGFFDYKDVDNDQIPEVFILYNGYEWTTMIVYKKLGGKYVKKLETTIFGC